MEDAQCDGSPSCHQIIEGSGVEKLSPSYGERLMGGDEEAKGKSESLLGLDGIWPFTHIKIILTRLIEPNENQVNELWSKREWTWEGKDFVFCDRFATTEEMDVISKNVSQMLVGMSVACESEDVTPIPSPEVEHFTLPEGPSESPQVISDAINVEANTPSPQYNSNSKENDDGNLACETMASKIKPSLVPVASTTPINNGRKKRKRGKPLGRRRRKRSKMYTALRKTKPRRDQVGQMETPKVTTDHGKNQDKIKSSTEAENMPSCLGNMLLEKEKCSIVAGSVLPFLSPDFREIFQEHEGEIIQTPSGSCILPEDAQANHDVSNEEIVQQLHPRKVVKKIGRGRPPGKRRRDLLKESIPHRKSIRNKTVPIETRQIIVTDDDSNHDVTSFNSSGRSHASIPQDKDILPQSKAEFPCPYCSDSFAQCERLIMHLLIHDAESKGMLSTLVGKDVHLKMENKISPVVEPVKKVDDFDTIGTLPTHEAESARRDTNKPKITGSTSETKLVQSSSSFVLQKKTFPPLKDMEIKLSRCDGTPRVATTSDMQSLGNGVPLGNNRSGMRKRQVKMIEVGDRKAFQTIVKICFSNGKSVWKCSICKKVFNFRSQAVTHARVHAGIKRYQCSSCLKRFLHRGNLNQHEWTHTDKERPWKCAICPKQYTTNVGLRMHMLFHTGERPHACSLCSKRFTLSADLTIHVRRHTGDMPHACGLCPKRCVTRTELKHHLGAHSARNAKKCPHCQIVFRSSYGVRRHIATAHPK